MVSEVKAFKDSRAQVHATKEQAVASELRFLLDDHDVELDTACFLYLVRNWQRVVQILEQMKT